MSSKTTMKSIAFPFFCALQTDKVFRHINRKKILILAYHGITKENRAILPWTVIPVESFEEQMDYISRKYHVISLQEVVLAMHNQGALPENPAVVTFDDGYRNNLTLALPVLEKYRMAATIFLTAGYVGGERLLPLDEVFLVITHARKKAPFTLAEIGLGPLRLETPEDVLESYRKTVAALKKLPTHRQKHYITVMKEAVGADYHGSDVLDDFLLLSWEETRSLLDTGLVQIGSHTVSHEILSNVSDEEAAREIRDSKTLIEEKTGQRITLFAYPNGTAQDYNGRHIRCLKENGFDCSVTTTSRLNSENDDLFRLGRICIGPDFTANTSHFALKVSGFSSALKRVVVRHVF